MKSRFVFVMLLAFLLWGCSKKPSPTPGQENLNTKKNETKTPDGKKDNTKTASLQTIQLQVEGMS